MGNTIYASFADPSQAEKAAGALLDFGVKPEHLSVVTTHAGEVHTESAIDANGNPVIVSQTTDDHKDKTEAAAKQGISFTTPEDAGAGAAKGAGWGLGAGAVAALAAMFVPGFGLIVGGGALAIALGGLAGATGAGAIAGAFTGYMKDQGIDHTQAEAYGKTVSEGGAILALTVPSGDVDEMKAHEILNKYGAANLNSFASTTTGYVA
ncbi:hypothetical protein BH11ARM1_BH11ARM1_16860 [soil metagenome]